MRWTCDLPMVTPNIVCLHSCYCRQYKKYCLLLFFPFLPQARSILFPKKDGWCTDTLWTHFMHIWACNWHLVHNRPKTCIIRCPLNAQTVHNNSTQSVYGQHQDVSEQYLTYLEWGKRAIREKKREKAIQIRPTITSMCTYNLGRKDMRCAVRTEGRDN